MKAAKVMKMILMICSKNIVFSLSLLIFAIEISMLQIVYFNKLFALKLIPFLIIIFVSGSLFEPL